MTTRDTQKTKTMTTGYFGKLPTQGDFVSIGLSHELVSELDGWLRQCLRESQKALGRKWLDQFLVSPVWRGVAARGLLQNDPVMMVMIPSVDRVGRYFPLVLAASFRGHDHDLTQIPKIANRWFDWAEDVALSILKPGFSRDQLEQALASNAYDVIVPENVKPMTNGQQGASLWWSAATSDAPRMFTGMPYPENFHETMMQAPTPPAPSVEAGPQTPVPTPKEEKPIRTLLELTYGAAALKGSRSTQLTDGYAIGTDAQALTVASGLGKHPGLAGVVDDLLDTMRGIENPFSMNDLIAEAKGKLGTANAKMRARGLPTNTTFAASCATLLIQSNRFAVIWSGNVRVYHLRDDQFTQLTRDHVDRLMPNVIIKALGASQQPNSELIHGDVLAGDRFIVCSASMTDCMTEREIGRALQTADTPQQAADHLTQDTVISGAPLDVAAITVLVSAKNCQAKSRF